MSGLTKEYFDQKFIGLEQRIINHIDEAQEELAIMTKNGFGDVLEQLDVRERVEKLEKDVKQLKLNHA